MTRQPSARLLAGFFRDGGYECTVASDAQGTRLESWKGRVTSTGPLTLAAVSLVDPSLGSPPRAPPVITLSKPFPSPVMTVGTTPVDSDARRVYISHGTHVVVMDADTDAIEGDIPDTPGVHGIAIASDLGRGFISMAARIPSHLRPEDSEDYRYREDRRNPDAIAYDPVSKRVFTFNGRGQDTTAINATDGSVVGTLALGGKPEFAVADGKGSIFVNNEDNSELIEFDTQKITETHRWPRRPANRPPASLWIEKPPPLRRLRRQSYGRDQRRHRQSDRHSYDRRRR